MFALCLKKFTLKTIVIATVDTKGEKLALSGGEMEIVNKNFVLIEIFFLTNLHITNESSQHLAHFI